MTPRKPAPTCTICGKPRRRRRNCPPELANLCCGCAGRYNRTPCAHCGKLRRSYSLLCGACRQRQQQSGHGGKLNRTSQLGHELREPRIPPAGRTCQAGPTPVYGGLTMPERPVIVCLCGSTRFKQAFIDANFRETMAGKIVLSVGWFSHADQTVYNPTVAEKDALDELHLRKIDLADEVLFLNVGGYMGQSTLRELSYAYQASKAIRFLEAVGGDVQAEIQFGRTPC